jgi:hypothetical protein
MSRNGLGNFNASDVIRRNQQRMLAVAKLRNDYARQQLETVNGLQSGLAGGKPITSLIIPAMKEAAITLTLAEYNNIMNSLTGGGAGGEDIVVSSGAPAAEEFYTPEGTPGRVFSLPYTVQGILLDSAGDRIILTYDITGNTYYIYKVTFSDASGTPVQQATGTEVQLGGNGRVYSIRFVKNILNNYFVGGHTVALPPNSLRFATITKYNSSFELQTTMVIRDAAETAMKFSAIDDLVTVGSNIYCSGLYGQQSTADFLIDGVTFPAADQGGGRITPFFCKFDDTLAPQWFTRIAPSDANAGGAGFTVDSNGNVYGSVLVIGEGDSAVAAGSWRVKTGAGSQTVITKTGEHIIVKLTDAGAIENSLQVWPYGFSSVGNDMGAQLFIDASNNIFAAYNIIFTKDILSGPGVTTDITIDFGNGVSSTFHRLTRTVRNFVILKLNTDLVPQAIYHLEMPARIGGSDYYNMWPKSITFDGNGNLLVNAAYTTSAAGNATITDNHGNDITLYATGSGNINAIDLLITNDLTTVNWTFPINGIRTDSVFGDSFYKNNGALIVDNTNNRLIKVDERANSSTVTVADGLDLPAVSGIQKSFLVEYV